MTIAAGAAPKITELSQAVAEVNDWRALGIFLFAFFILREIGIAYGKRQDRLGAEKLAKSVSELTTAIRVNGEEEIKHQARVESHITLQANLLERAERTLERLNG